MFEQDITHVQFEKRGLSPEFLIHFKVKGKSYCLVTHCENGEWVADDVIHMFYDLCPLCKSDKAEDDFACQLAFPNDFLLNHPNVRLLLLFETDVDSL